MMKVIHDDETGGIATIPLIIDWGVSKMCQVKGCGEKTSAILSVTADESPTGKALLVGICEKHYQESKVGDEEYHFKQTITV
jgi:hypothetical protein